MSRKIKKSVSILLVLVMLCGVLAVAPVTVSATITEYTTSTGGVYTFNSETGELHLISGEFKGSPWTITKSSVLSVTADEGVYFTGSCADMFYGFSKCTSINLRNVNTSSVTNMYRMFYNCTSLKNLNVSNFNTEKVTIIRAMFWQCSNLTELDLSSFNLQNVVDGNVTISGQSQIAYGGIFKDCIKLRSLTISDKFKFGTKKGIIGNMNLNNGKPTNQGWITSDSTDGKIVSGDGENAIISDIPEIDPNQPDDNIPKTYVWFDGNYEFIEETGTLHLISGFFNCDSWQKTGFDDANITWTANGNDIEESKKFKKEDVLHVTADEGVKFSGDCRYMFCNYHNCESIDLSNVDTSNVTRMWCMFYNCTSLTSLNVSNFDTSKVTAIRYMFGNCEKLTELDLSSFNTINIKDENIEGISYKLPKLENVFEGCSNLSKLIISDKFNWGILAKMKLNNGGVDGWRISPSDYAERVSGNGNSAVIAAPADITTYKWIQYATVTWKNWNDSTLDTDDYKLETIIHPTYKDATPTRPDTYGKTYSFAGWTDGENTYGLNDELPIVTGDITYTALYTETSTLYTLNYIYQGRKGGNNGGYVGDDGATDTKTYTVTVELGDSDLEASGVPKAKVLVDNAPMVNDPYKDCIWTIDDSHVVFDSETKTVTLTAEQPERKYSVVFKDSNNATTDVFRVKLNEFVKKNDSFISAPESDGSGQPFAYWSVTQNGKEVARCFEKRFNLRVTGDIVVTAHYGEASNLVTLSNAEYSRQQFTDASGNKKDYLYADFIPAYMDKNGVQLSTKSSDEYKSGIIIQYSQDVKVAKENAPGATLSESDKLTYASGDMLSTENAKKIASGETISGGKYTYISSPISNSKYNEKTV